MVKFIETIPAYSYPSSRAQENEPRHGNQHRASTNNALLSELLLLRSLLMRSISEELPSCRAPLRFDRTHFPNSRTSSLPLFPLFFLPRSAVSWANTRYSEPGPGFWPPVCFDGTIRRNNSRHDHEKRGTREPASWIFSSQERVVLRPFW